MSKTELKNCNQCKNACPVESLQCGRGEAFVAFVKEGGDPTDFNADEKHVGHGKHEGHGHGEGRGHGHHGSRGPMGKPEDLMGLMRACGHALHHGNAGEEFFDVLNDEEKEKLKELLKKIIG